MLQPDGFDRHAWIDGLEHVVQRQQTHGDGGHRFHLDAGLTDRAATAAEGQPRQRFVAPLNNIPTPQGFV